MFEEEEEEEKEWKNVEMSEEAAVAIDSLFFVEFRISV